jgi:hypothetical protein
MSNREPSATLSDFGSPALMLLFRKAAAVQLKC